MADNPTAPVFDTSSIPVPSEPMEIITGVVRLTAPNGGPYTSSGTNAYVVGHASVVVVDPGPTSRRHREALRQVVAGRPVEAILLTHTHRDHSASAAALRRETGAPLWFGGQHRLSRPARLSELNSLAWAGDWRLLPDRTFYDGESATVGGFELTAIATPGHCANHFCYGIGDSKWLLSGDHIMGWNSTLVAPPDGSMADYLASLRKVIALPYAHYLPGHGGAVLNGPSHASALLAHRELRNRQIVGAVQNGATRIVDLLERVYPALAPALHRAAAWTLTAHIEYLENKRAITVRRTPLGLRLAPV